MVLRRILVGMLVAPACVAALPGLAAAQPPPPPPPPPPPAEPPPLEPPDVDDDDAAAVDSDAMPLENDEESNPAVP